MTAVSVETLGSPRPAGRADEEVLSAVRAGFPGIWSPVALPAAEPSTAPFVGVAARLGAAAPDLGARDAEQIEAEGAADDRDILLAEPVTLGDRFAGPDRFSLKDPEPAPAPRRPLAQVVRRMARQAGNAQPYPSTQAYVAQHRRAAAPAVAAARPRDRSGFVMAVLIMVTVWAGVVGVGVMFFNTPRSGMKIEWR